jgi:hypothetical protein
VTPGDWEKRAKQAGLTIHDLSLFSLIDRLVFVFNPAVLLLYSWSVVRTLRHRSSCMATAIRDQGKTVFVKEFLSNHPQGNLQAVNEAWTAAGKDGSIGPTLIQKLRLQMGLSGNLGTKPKSKTPTRKAPVKKKAPPKRKAAPNKSREAPATLGKTSFVKEFLNDHPQGNTAAVNGAWTEAGMTGTISTTLVNKMRASLGLSGSLGPQSRTSSTTTARRRERPVKGTLAPVDGKPSGLQRGRRSNRTTILMALEEGMDRLIFGVMGIGNLPEVESALRDARRQLYAALTS